MTFCGGTIACGGFEIAGSGVDICGWCTSFEVRDFLRAFMASNVEEGGEGV